MIYFTCDCHIAFCCLESIWCFCSVGQHCPLEECSSLLGLRLGYRTRSGYLPGGCLLDSLIRLNFGFQIPAHCLHCLGTFPDGYYSENAHYQCQQPCCWCWVHYFQQSLPSNANSYSFLKLHVYYYNDHFAAVDLPLCFLIRSSHRHPFLQDLIFQHKFWCEYLASLQRLAFSAFYQKSEEFSAQQRCFHHLCSCSWITENWRAVDLLFDMVLVLTLIIINEPLASSTVPAATEPPYNSSSQVASAHLDPFW